MVACIGIAAQLPWVLPLLKEKIPALKGSDKPAQPNKKLFMMGALFLSALVGLLIPSTFVAASPQEFIDINYFYNPVWYVVHTLCLSVGTFLVWFGVFYWLANPKGKVIFSYIVWILSGIMLVNYMFFGTNLGVVSPDLNYADGFWFARKEHIINLITVVILFVDLLLLVRKFPKAITSILLVGSIALSCMGIINIVKINASAQETKQQLLASADNDLSFNMTKDGKNVVVIMLDRAIGPFVPYLMEENPTLQEQFDGFTYYANTLSYGAFTNFATPALYGGYEYTPVKLNERNTELLAAKHNEALKVMPTIFAEADFDVTLIDPSYAGYKWIPDVSIYNDIPGVNAFRADGVFDDPTSSQRVVSARLRNFFFFSVMKTAPVSLQAAIYTNGTYNSLPAEDGSGLYAPFMSAYHVIQNMSNMTNITSGTGNTYMFLRSNVTHEPTLLQEPTFTPSSYVDNSAYYPSEGKTITAGNSSILLDSTNKIIHYQTNMAALMQLGNWFDYLRENGVYDNTRIIIVADHGRNLNIFDTADTSMHLTEFYRPMLLVKDFGATGFTTSEEFMTNADVPALSLEGLIDNPVNPFTGEAINSNYKIENSKQHVLISDEWNITTNNGFQFLPSQWATVTGDVRDKDNWTFHTDLSVFPPDLQ
jgi:hypothetical protein